MLSRPGGAGSAVVEALDEPVVVHEAGPVGRTARRLKTHGVHLVSNLCGDDVVGRRVRVAVLRAAGADLAPGVMMGGGTYISRPAHLVVGVRSYIGRNCYLDLESQLVIGTQVAIGHGVSFITTKHEVGPPELRCGKFTSEAITVGDGAWLGANVTVLPGVSIGAGSVVAAGAVVAVDVPANTVVGGMRARVIKSLD